MRILILTYCFLLVGVMTVLSFVYAQDFSHIVSAIVFFPLFAYFSLELFPARSAKKVKKHAAVVAKQPSLFSDLGTVSVPTSSDLAAETGQVLEQGFDIDRRMFLKIIASAGTGLFMMSLFTKKSHAAFFGSVPGPGVIGIKDSAGDLIDPAIKTPTDGYKISEVDDASSPAYYGFVDKTGAWFIMKEESSGAYRYTKGDTSFSTNWSNRAVLTYGYFDSIF